MKNAAVHQVSIFFRTGMVFLACMSLQGQVLLVDRPVSQAGEAGSRVRLGGSKGFLADHFKIGAPGEVWVIDAIRTWAEPEGGRAASAGELYESITLFGGIESAPPKPGEPECDCHNLIKLKSARLAPAPERPDIRIAQAAAGMWQVDFQNLSWSVPGGVDIQFGVMGVGRPAGRYPWYNSAAVTNAEHQIKVFDENGKFVESYVSKEAPLEKTVGMNVQVWGHKPASIAIRSRATVIEVVLSSDATVDATQADLKAFRLGPKGATPVNTRLEKAAGQTSLVLTFRPGDTGIQPSDVTACLSGRLQDGVPFQGCDLLKSKGH